MTENSFLDLFNQVAVFFFSSLQGFVILFVSINMRKFMDIIYFIRHAKPDLGVQDETHPLTSEGHKAVKQIVKLLEPIKISRCFCSPYTRAI